ncbi:hypothetical protein [Sediminibacillus massiliensis]|uniref:hypothetical protein n=1 Tax=Sediminibacillus massiliensis TaxID=1926277 RepID=UPI0015C30525|nr:hypothetical protein [Sediminibacillus massiliensis]
MSEKHEKQKDHAKSMFPDIDKINVSKGEKTLLIDNPTTYPLIGMGAQGAVFQLSDDKCVKIYPDPLKAQMEQEAIKAGEHLDFFPEIYETGDNYTVMEFFQAPTLKEYLKNSTFLPESITKKLLHILNELKRAEFTMIDAPLRHIFVLDNEELKVIDHVNSFKRQHPVPLKLLRDLNIILLKEAFLDQVKRLDPAMYEEWDNYYHQNKLDYKEIAVTSGGSGSAVKVDSAVSQTLIGKGHQGAVYRIAEDRCVKIYPKPDHAKQEQEVLLSNQDLSFIPKVYDTGDNYVVMEYLLGPDLNSFLKKQSELSIDITKRIMDILTAQIEAGFKLIDAPLRHVFVTADGFKMVDHVYSNTREQNRPLELFQNLHERNFLDAFLNQIKELHPSLHDEWTKEPIPLQSEENTDDEPILLASKVKASPENTEPHVEPLSPDEETGTDLSLQPEMEEPDSSLTESDTEEAIPGKKDKNKKKTEIDLDFIKQKEKRRKRRKKKRSKTLGEALWYI